MRRSVARLCSMPVSRTTLTVIIATEEGSRGQEGRSRSPEQQCADQLSTPTRADLKCGIVGMPNVGKSTLLCVVMLLTLTAQQYHRQVRYVWLSPRSLTSKTSAKQPTCASNVTVVP